MQSVFTSAVLSTAGNVAMVYGTQSLMRQARNWFNILKASSLSPRWQADSIDMSASSAERSDEM